MVVASVYTGEIIMVAFGEGKEDLSFLEEGNFDYSFRAVRVACVREEEVAKG